MAELVLVPAVEVGAGTGTAVIRDARTGRRRRVEGVGKVVLCGGVVCLELPAAARDGGLVEVLLPGFGSCWVEPLDPTRKSAA